MTRKLEETLGLPHLSDLLQEEGITDPAVPRYPASPHTQPDAAVLLEDTDHADAMDDVYKETLRHAQNIADLGYNIEPAKAPRMFEVAAQFYKAALDAKNSKRDAQLKAMKLVLDQRRLELDAAAAGHQIEPVETKAVIHADRNELIKQLRSQVEAEKS